MKTFYILLLLCCFHTMLWAQKRQNDIIGYKELIRDNAQTFTEEQRNYCFKDYIDSANSCFAKGKESPTLAYDAALLSKELYTALVRIGQGQRDASEIARTLQATWRDIQEALPKKACAVEFVDYEKDGQTKMGAIFLSKQGNPIWVDLPSPDSIYKCPVKGEKASKRIFSKVQDKKNELYNSSNMICDLLWPESLVDLLKNKKEVYFSPTNYQHFIAIEYVVPAALEHVRFHRLSSTRKLLEEKRATDTSKALLCGGIVYNKQVLRINPKNDSIANQYFGVPLSKYLSGSYEMVSNICTIRNNEHDSLISGIDAEESFFLKQCTRYPYVFISTHGLFKPSSPNVIIITSPRTDNMLSHSALLMAGGTYKDDKELQSLRTGLLSAKEFSEVDLSNVDLFVLSTCDSGLGYLTDDGIYGLRKGLQLAGVRCIISTLWELDDYVNVDFMSLFNLYLSQGHTPDDAMYMTRKEFMTRKEYAEPRYYDVFIVTDGWQ